MCTSPERWTMFSFTSLSLTNLIWLCARYRLASFALTSRLIQKLARPTFEQGSLSRKNCQDKLGRVYGALGFLKVHPHHTTAACDSLPWRMLLCLRSMTPLHDLSVNVAGHPEDSCDWIGYVRINNRVRRWYGVRRPLNKRKTQQTAYGLLQCQTWRLHDVKSCIRQLIQVCAYAHVQSMDTSQFSLWRLF